MKTLFRLLAFLSASALVSACATTLPVEYVFEDCDSLQALAGAQNYDASVRGVSLENDRGLEEIRAEPGSSLIGRSRRGDEEKLRDDRRALREAYSRKGCKP